LVPIVARQAFARGRQQLTITTVGFDSMLQEAAAANGRLIARTVRPRVFGSSKLADRMTRLWRRLTWRAIRRRIALAFAFEAEERTYRLTPADAAELPSSSDISRDRWDDLDKFIPTEPRHDREAILADWRQRRERGEHVYTCVEDGRLVAYGWVVEGQKTMRLDWVKQSVDLPDGTAVIYDFYTLPEYRHRDFYQRLLMHAMQDAARMRGIRLIALSILASDTVPRWWVERLGMECTGSYFYRRVLWHRKTWRLTPTPA
jgi:GNAT superfamily N-acetyltransferase